MKKLILLAICFSFISSIACAIPPSLRLILSEAGEGVRFMAKRSISTLKATPGFKPDKQPIFPIQKANLPTRVKFLDEGHESYIPLDENLLKERELRMPIITRENNSIHIELKKK